MSNQQKDIEAFVDAIRDQFPELIRAATGGDVEQVEDRELTAWTAGGEGAFEIYLSNGAGYQITVKQTAQVRAECERCGHEFHEDEIDPDSGMCVPCTENEEGAAG